MINRITTFLLTLVVCVAHAHSQVQATSADQTILLGKQCSSLGVARAENAAEAKATAERYRVFALSKARQKGRNSFTRKEGGGVAFCEPVQPIGKTANVRLSVETQRSHL